MTTVILARRILIETLCMKDVWHYTIYLKKYLVNGNFPSIKQAHVDKDAKLQRTFALDRSFFFKPVELHIAWEPPYS